MEELLTSGAAGIPLAVVVYIVAEKISKTVKAESKGVRGAIYSEGKATRDLILAEGRETRAALRPK